MYPRQTHKEDGMSEHVELKGEMRNLYKILIENPTRKDHFGFLHVEKIIITL
jgi:hypothetical protein